MVSARAGDANTEEGLRAGADDYLVKPFSARGLLARVEAHLRLAALRKQVQAEARRSAERMIETNKLEMIGRLSAGIAHDFNNLLTAINGYADLGISRESGVIQCLLEIREAGRKAADTIKLLLAYGRRQFIHPERLDLNAVVRDVGQSMRQVLGGSIRFVSKLDAALTPIRADREQMALVILNLALNARDAMEHGGTLTVETSNCPSGNPPDEAPEQPEAGTRFVRLSVTDTGTGIDPQDMERIFEPYFTAAAPSGADDPGQHVPGSVGEGGGGAAEEQGLQA